EDMLDQPIRVEDTGSPGTSFAVRERESYGSALNVDGLREYALDSDATTADVWCFNSEGQSAFAGLAREGKGTVLTVADGYIASNRFIDQAQNASLLMRMVSTIAPKGSRIVFTEATYSDTEPGLMELLGPGAVGAWYQGIFLFIVIVYSLGKRFGLPDETRPAQTGQRELVEAIADAYRRAGATRIACRSAYDRADLQVRRALKISRDAPASERDARLPSELAAAFRRTFEATIDDTMPHEAFAICRNLRKNVGVFVSSRPGLGR
ncbi:MAG TPA: hypothetical protein VMI31_12665, partial [Fimbriimonadaceae bacterium]|nr:hypothetical protein [Fimbriimonadaceae bacterium]